MGLRNLTVSLTLLVTATLLASIGALKVSIKEYDVPTPKARPHDPAVSPDGALWVTEQMANKLGRLDPNTGQFREYPLKTPDSGPHGLVADKQGNIWFAAIFKGYIGKLDPKSGEITEYRMPDPPPKVRASRGSVGAYYTSKASVIAAAKRAIDNNIIGPRPRCKPRRKWRY